MTCTPTRPAPDRTQYIIETGNVCTRTDTHAPMVRSDISDRSNLQRELRAPIFLPNNDGNQNPRPGRSNIPAFRNGKVEFPDKGDQERLDLCEAAICG